MITLQLTFSIHLILPQFHLSISRLVSGNVAMLIHYSEAYINQAIQFRKIYYSTRNLIHSSFIFHQTIHSSHKQINSEKSVSLLFSKAIQTKKKIHHFFFIEDQVMKKKIDTRKMQDKMDKFLQLIFHFCLLVHGIQLQRQKK